MTDAQIAKKAKLTVPGVRYKRQRGWSDDEIIAGVQATKNETLIDAQLRKESALANLRELEYAQKQGDLIPVRDALNAWSVLVQLVRTKIGGMANACADQLAAITDPTEVRMFLMRETDDRLSHLANDFRQAAIDSLDGGGESDQPADQADGDGVGGVESDSKQ